MFCKKCKKLLLKRIKYLEKLGVDSDRYFLIQQLYWLIDKENIPDLENNKWIFPNGKIRKIKVK